MAVTVTGPRPPVFGVLRIGSYLRLWSGSTVVFLGVMAQSVARSWLAFELTGSNTALGGVLLAFGLAMVVTTPVAGVVGDRFPKRTVLTASIALLGATSAWIGFAVAFHVVAYWMLLVAGALQAVAFAHYNPARMAFVTEIVPEDRVPEAVTLMLVNAEASRVAGPALAGVAIAGLSWGLEAVFLVCAVLFAAGLVAGLKLPLGAPDRSEAAPTPWGDLMDGLRYVRARRDLSLLLLCVFGVIMIGLPHLAFLPTLSGEVFHKGSAGYGLLSACSAAGAVTAGMFVGRVRDRIGPWQTVVLAGCALGVGLVGTGLAPSFGVALLLLVPVGAGMLVFQTVTQSLLMQRSRHRFHARVQGLVMLSVGGFGVVALPLGMLADAVGLRATLVGMGVVVLLVVLAFALASRRHWSEEDVATEVDLAVEVEVAAELTSELASRP